MSLQNITVDYADYAEPATKQPDNDWITENIVHILGTHQGTICRHVSAVLIC